MTTRHVRQRQGVEGIFPECADDECQATKDDYGKQHGQSAATTLAPVPGLVEMLLAATAMMESIGAMLFVGGADVVAWESIEVADGFDIGVEKGVEGVIRGSREWTH